MAIDQVGGVAAEALEGALSNWLRRVPAERRPTIRRRLLQGLLLSAAAAAGGVAMAATLEGAAQVVGIVVIVVSALSLLTCQVAVVALNELERVPALQDRIAVLAEALNHAAVTIDEIEQEVEARRELVAELERDATRYEQLSGLHRSEVEAVVQTLQLEFRQAGKRTAWLTWIQGFVWFALGVGAAIAVSLIFGT